MRDAFIEQLTVLAENDEKVMLLTVILVMES